MDQPNKQFLGCNKESGDQIPYSSSSVRSSLTHSLSPLSLCLFPHSRLLSVAGGSRCSSTHSSWYTPPSYHLRYRTSTLPCKASVGFGFLRTTSSACLGHAGRIKHESNCTMLTLTLGWHCIQNEISRTSYLSKRSSCSVIYLSDSSQSLWLIVTWIWSGSNEIDAILRKPSHRRAPLILIGDGDQNPSRANREVGWSTDYNWKA